MLCCFRVAGNVLAKIIQRLNYLNHNVASMKEEVALIPVAMVFRQLLEKAYNKTPI